MGAQAGDLDDFLLCTQEMNKDERTTDSVVNGGELRQPEPSMQQYQQALDNSNRSSYAAETVAEHFE